MRAKGLILLVMAVLAALSTNPGAAGAAAAADVSTFTLVGPGGAREWSRPEYSVETSRQSSRSLIVRVMDGYEELVSLHVEAPWEEPLTVGTYDGATSRLQGKTTSDFARNADRTWQRTGSSSRDS